MRATNKPVGKGLSKIELEVLATIEEHAMLRPGDRVALACSGGADSTALLYILKELSSRFGWILSVAHFNHQLRGAESDADEQFVRQLARDNNLHFISRQADVRQLARNAQANLEATARKARYAFLHSLIASGRVDRVAVGHHQDDQAETVLLRLLRGTGGQGLGSIRPVLSTGIIRPLLGVRGREIRQWLSHRGIPWREDASNQSVEFRRNHLRREILPALKKINPGIVDVLSHTARLAQVDELFWNKYISFLVRKHVRRQAHALEIRLSVLCKLPSAATLRLLKWALEYLADSMPRTEIEPEKSNGYPDYRQIKSLYDWAKLDGTSVPSPNRREKPLALPRNLEAHKTARHLIISVSNSDRKLENGKVAGYSHTISGPASISLAAEGITVKLEFVAATDGAGAYNKIGDTLLDRSKLVFPVVLRSWRPGDAYQPVGRHKSRKLKELFQRHKIIAPLRHTWPVLESAGRIVWVRQFGPAEGFTPGNVGGHSLRITISEISASNK